MNINLNLLANRYAYAMFSLSKEKNIIFQVQNDLIKITSILYQDQVLTFMKNNFIHYKNKIDIMKIIINKTNISDIVKNYINLIIKNKKFFLLNKILEKFNILVNDFNNEIIVQILSAVPLSNDNINNLKKILSQLINKKVTIQYRINKFLIGGIIINIGSYMIDMSLYTKLKLLKFMMKELD